MTSVGFRAFAVVVALVFQCAAANSETFTFAVGDWPPFTSRDAPGFGMHAQKVTETFRAAGHDVRFEFLPWLRSFEMTRHGTLPATFSWIFEKERAEDFIYPETPIALASFVYFYRKDRFPAGLQALSFEEVAARGLTVVGIPGYWYQAPLEKAGVLFQAVPEEEQAWNMLARGRADLYIEIDRVGRAHSRAVLDDAAESIAMSEPIRVYPLYILFSKTHPDGARMKNIWDAQADPARISSAGPAIR
ncbi:substrate-binding periplasmic protein [Roseibium marinum]|uniref:Solute-binding protein family 3/N-terminal domain-containing protein n=1 Tax=Roseibium marinum TaxID=281252 RepID=A0A2S3UYT2_9HYPH|nr:hypothetical protein [Roseibium marinum]POF32892.1 hypothetical protein CLV41_102298 [Roseibium marinum]